MPVLVLIDVQKEYITQGRAFCLETIQESLDNCKKLLAHARANSWKVIHMHHEQNAENFSRGSEFSEFIEGFEPNENEKSIAKSDFSCFTAPEFTALMDKYRHENILIAGYGCTMCCLSTLVDAHHRGFEFYFVKDATCAKSTPNFEEQDMKAHALDILTAFSTLVTTQQVLAKSGNDNEGFE